MKRICLGLVLVALGWAQDGAPLRFDVASVKPATGSSSRFRFNDSPGRIHYTNVSLRELIIHAYRCKNYQLEAPGWVDSERYDIDATFPVKTQARIPEMLTSLLAERFKLRAQLVEKSDKVLALRLRPKGIGILKPASEPGRGGVAFTGDKISGNLATMDSLSDLLTALLKMSVVDDTGLTERYTFDLKMPPEANATGQADSSAVIASLKEIGLTLVSTTAASKHVIIETAERVPVEN